MNAKRLLSILVCLLLVASVFLVSCQDDTAESSTGDSKTDTYGGENIEDYGVTMPEFKWADNPDYETFTVCVTDNVGDPTYFCEDVEPDLYTTTDAVLNDAVRKRNDEILAKYGVEIKAAPVPNVVEALKLDITSNMCEYDAALPFMRGATTLAQENQLYDLNEFSDYLHLDKEWWDQSANSSLSIGDKLYFTTGDISIMPKIVSVAVTFNKTMLSKNFPETDLYQMVRDHEWTFEKMIEMSRKVTADTDGTTGMTYDDTWGLSSSYGDAIAFYIGSGKNLIEKDSDNLPVLSLDNEASMTLVQKVLSELQISDEWVWHCDVITGSDKWVISLDVFGQNRALFRTSAFSAIKKLRAYDDCEEFGIVPLPLMTEDQDDYYTYSSATLATCAVIPVSLGQEAAEFSAFMLEVMAFGGMKHITPAYYETTLKYRDFRDADSEEMLDEYIFDNVVYDLGVIYNFGNVSSMISGLMSSKSTDIASTLDTNKDAIESAIDDCLEIYGI